MTNEIQNTKASEHDTMFELDMGQMENVSGGLIPLAIALGVVVTHVPEITDFVDGFFEAL